MVVQRRCLRTSRDLDAGTVLREDMVEALRPAPCDAVMPFDLAKVLGKQLTRGLKAGEQITWTSLRDAEAR